ncbi:MAG: glucose-6-phosphate dehydrogenase [Luteitalea sp.]|nr:glucose-6-phosphate dehydrogenase [Luteitalea sp.]
MSDEKRDTAVVDETRALEPAATPPGPCVMVIFGATGDLTKRKLLPALVNLRQERLLGERFAIVGVGRQTMSDELFRDRMLEDFAQFATRSLSVADTAWLRKRLSYVAGDPTDPDLYTRLERHLAEVDQRCHTEGNYLFYLAMPPSLFMPVSKHLARAGLVAQANTHWRRVVIEKPFGHDLASARDLNRRVSTCLSESQVYRIDHYLGKETVQNLMIFRFANGIFEPIWNRRYVDHVQISVAETVGVEQRGSYYEQAGALRDMVQNHLFMLLALTAMEPPSSFEADAVRSERLKVLQAITPFTPDEVRRYTVRGQYGDGVSTSGERLPAYRSEDHVVRDSDVETYVAWRLMVENWRWAGVPFYVRTGKRLPKRVSEIAIQFKSPPFVMFRKTNVESLQPNILVVRIQPDEGISLRFDAKVPGQTLRLGTVKMNFHYEDYFGESPSTGYETLLYDSMMGDATLFHRADIVEEGWEKVMPVLDAWQHEPVTDFPNYAAGSWGPEAADELLRRDGRSWRRL